MNHPKKIFAILLAISLNLNWSLSTAQAFLLPGNSSLSDETSSSNSMSSLGTFLSSSSNSTQDRNQMGADNDKENKVPKVTVIITPSHPKNDDMVYSQALPENFRNTSSNLYYNWYIYNSDPKVGTTVVKNGQKIFIPSNTTQGALIRGAAAQARGSYIPGTTPTAKDNGKANEDPTHDRDGYNAHYGGDDGQGAIEKKIEDILGKNFDFNYGDFTKNCKQNCDVEYSNSENESKWKYDKCAEPTCGDWIDKCCYGAKNDYGTCLSNIWDDVQSSCFDEVCDNKKATKKEDCYSNISIDDYASCDSNFFDQENKCVTDRNLFCLNRGSCGSKPAQDCVDCEQAYHNSQWASLKQKDLCEKQCEVKENNSLGSSAIEPVGSRCFRYNFGGRDSADHMAGIFQPITCSHYYPGADNPDNVIDWKDTIPFKTGDGSFKDDEELFWGTDPSNADTDGDGFPDEADIVGQGQQLIQFKYQSGDKIGVTVEGTSLFPTNDKTPYYKIMWAQTGTCDAEVIKSANRDNPGFDSLCKCNDSDKQDNCKNSNDFGFGYLKLNDIYQDISNSRDNRLDTFININPLKPIVSKPLELEAITSGGNLDKDLLSYEWTIKHGGEVLKAEPDPSNSRIVWKKQGVEVAYTDLQNQAANFNGNGGVGWEKINLVPILEGDYDALVKAVETNGNKQMIGEGTIKFPVSESLKMKFYRTLNVNSGWAKKDELLSRETIPGDNVLIEYDGPFYDDFVWYVDRKKLEGNSPKVSLSVDKGANTVYNFKLVASNKNRTDMVEDEFVLNVVNPYVSIRQRGEAPDNMAQNNQNTNNNLNPTKKNGFTYQVPIGTDLEFLAIRNPVGSSFTVRDDLHYFWSFDQAEPQEGKDSYKVTLDGSKYLPGTPHSLAVKIYTPDKKLLAQDQATLIPVNDKNSKIVDASRRSIAGLATAYLNIPDNLKFILQTLLWVFFVFLLLSAIAWISPIKKPLRT